MQEPIASHYPSVIRQIKEMQQIAKAEDMELSKLKAAMDEVMGNMFVATANEAGVRRFEKLLGVKLKAAQGLSDRKAYLLSMMRKRKMSLSDLFKELSAYSSGIRLEPDYVEGRLRVSVDEAAQKLSAMLEALDGLLPLNVYIFFEVWASMRLTWRGRAGKLTLRIPVHAWRWSVGMKLDGRRQLGDGHGMVRALLTIRIKLYLLRREAVGGVAVITKTADHWLLDGSLPLDGARRLNSIYRKETVE